MHVDCSCGLPAVRRCLQCDVPVCPTHSNSDAQFSASTGPPHRWGWCPGCIAQHQAEMRNLHEHQSAAMARHQDSKDELVRSLTSHVATEIVRRHGRPLKVRRAARSSFDQSRKVKDFGIRGVLIRTHTDDRGADSETYLLDSGTTQGTTDDELYASFGVITGPKFRGSWDEHTLGILADWMISHQIKIW